MKVRIAIFIIIILVAAFFAADYFFDITDHIIEEEPIYADAFVGEVNIDLTRDVKTKNEAAIEAFSLISGDDFKYLIFGNGNHADILSSSDGFTADKGLYSVSEWQFRTILNDIYKNEGVEFSKEDVDAGIKASLAVLDAFTSSSSSKYEYQYSLNPTGDYTKDHKFTAFGCEIRGNGHTQFGAWRAEAGVDFSCDNKKLRAVYIIDGYKTTSMPEMTVLVNADVTNNRTSMDIDWLPSKGETKNINFLVRYEVEIKQTSVFAKPVYTLQVRDVVVL